MELFGVCPMVFFPSKRKDFPRKFCILVCDYYFGLLILLIILFGTQQLLHEFCGKSTSAPWVHRHKVFCLWCDVPCDASRINKWILHALQHNVRKLFLALCGLLDAYTFPPCLFSCDLLEDLTLEMSRSTQKMGCVLKLPRCICFSSLKSLYLKYVTFEVDYSTKSSFQVAQSWRIWL